MGTRKAHRLTDVMSHWKGLVASCTKFGYLSFIYYYYYRRGKYRFFHPIRTFLVKKVLGGPKFIEYVQILFFTKFLIQTWRTKPDWNSSGSNFVPFVFSTKRLRPWRLWLFTTTVPKDAYNTTPHSTVSIRYKTTLSSSQNSKTKLFYNLKYLRLQIVDLNFCFILRQTYLFVTLDFGTALFVLL